MNGKRHVEAPHAGVYGSLRWKLSAIAADRQKFENAPLGPRQRERLKREIDAQQVEIDILNKQRRERLAFIRARKTVNLK